MDDFFLNFSKIVSNSTVPRYERDGVLGFL